MRRSYLRTEHLFIAAAFLVALALRFSTLGGLPLSDSEAANALQALPAPAVEAAQNAPVQVQPAYTSLTRAIFSVFSASNAAARFWPALAGSLLALLPFLFRRYLGQLPAVLLAFFIALDPGLLAVSRQADSLAMALFFPLLALGVWAQGSTGLFRSARPASRWIAAGVFAGMALLSGPAVWPVMLALGLALWAVGVQNEDLPAVVEEHLQAGTPAVTQHWKLAGLAALATVFVVGTLFFSIPGGLSAAAASLSAYMLRWGQPSGVPVLLFFTALLLYGFLPLVLGLWGGIAGLVRRDPLERFLLVWWLIALTLAAANPGRAVADLSWSLLPLWALAARQAARLLRLPAGDRGAAAGQALLSGVILAFVSLSLVGAFNNTNLTMQELAFRLIGATVMLAASAGLVWWGWSRLVAMRGLVLGAASVLLAYMVSMGFDAAGFTPGAGRELWQSNAAPRGAPVLAQTIQSLGQWGPRVAGGPDVVVVEEDSPALRWLLRDFNRVQFTQALPADASPAIVITPDQPELGLAAAYRGQSIVWEEDVIWNSMYPAEWFRWTVFRAVPVPARDPHRVILWARLDLFPGGNEAGAAAQGGALPGGAEAQPNPQ